MVLSPVSEVTAPQLKSVAAEDTIRDVVEEMLSEGYSQMGVKRDEELIGTISYRSIARTVLITEALYDSPRDLGDRAVETAVETPPVIESGANLSELLSILGERSYVLVEEDEKPTKIITDYNLREYWRRSTEPFLLIEETELALRDIINSEFEEDLEEALYDLSTNAENLREVDTLEDCSFSHYKQFISERWDDGFDAYFNQRQDFIRNLINTLSENRNQLFHFRIEDREELDLDIIEFGHGYFTALQPDTN